MTTIIVSSMNVSFVHIPTLQNKEVNSLAETGFYKWSLVVGTWKFLIFVTRSFLQFFHEQPAAYYLCNIVFDVQFFFLLTLLPSPLFFFVLC